MSTDTATEAPLKIIIVMGVTGAGKSHFINTLYGEPVTEEGDDLRSCTQRCALVPLQLGETKLLLLDTPGFDDTSRTDTEVLREIANILTALHESGAQLYGIIYLHRISDIRCGNSAVRTFEICKEICGEKALKNVLLVTSRWGDVSEVIGARRESQLREDFWSFMLRDGSKMSRYHDTRVSGITLVGEVLANDPVVLDIQKELVDEQKNLLETRAGAYLNEGLETTRAQHEQGLEILEGEKGDIGEDETLRRKKWQKAHDKEVEGLRKAEGARDDLETPVAREVLERIERKKRRSRMAAATGAAVKTFLPWTLEILGLFVGAPPGTATLLTAWIAESAGGEAGATEIVGDLLQS